MNREGASKPAMSSETAAVSTPQPTSPPARSCRIWGIDFVPWTFDETVDQVDRLIQKRKPCYFVTANLNYMMLAHTREDVREAARRALFVTPDGIPLVIASRWKGTRLPGRVTGADLIYGLCALAAQRDYGVYFFGAGPGIADEAARRLQAKYPGLRVTGVESPPYRDLTPEETHGVVERIRAAQPDLLFVSLSQPKGELWLMRNFEAMGIPASVQVGAAVDFAAGKVSRAPSWVQKIGMEMPYRLLQDPRRLAPRYARNAAFLARAVCGDLRDFLLRRPQS